MTYKKVYPSNLKFELTGTKVNVSRKEKSDKNSDIWGIKYLFDKNMLNAHYEVEVMGKISKTMALRMYFLKYLFPNVIFHNADGDQFISVAEEIKENIGKEYITYKSNKRPLRNRGTKNKLESLIEKELYDNLSKYIHDFPAGVTVIRQFPSNIFKKKISEKTRITDKLWIDMISVNTDNELSAIELKVGGNIPLGLFAQGLNYGIYCYLFKKHIMEQWFNEQFKNIKDKVTIYYIGEEFHPALIGRDENKGIVSLIRKNDLFNVVFVKIDVDKKANCIKGNPRVIFDTRSL